MKYYLSSYKFGDRFEELKNILKPGAKIAHINNAKDFTASNAENKMHHLKEEMDSLTDLGFENAHLDLKEYFGKEAELQEKLSNVDGVWVCGGNTFVLRQAMYLSGFDNIFPSLKKQKNFVWAGYSAGMCILSDSLKYIEQVDDANDFPYEGISNAIYEGLGVFDFGWLPHYRSDHFESPMIDKEVEKCIENKWLFKTLRDGEVVIGEIN